MGGVVFLVVRALSPPSRCRQRQEWRGDAHRDRLCLHHLVLCYALVSGLVRRRYLAPALIFVAVGMVLGPSGFGVLEVGAGTQGFTILAQLALTVILFNQASRLDLRTVAA